MTYENLPLSNTMQIRIAKREHEKLGGVELLCIKKQDTLIE